MPVAYTRVVGTPGTPCTGCRCDKCRCTSDGTAYQLPSKLCVTLTGYAACAVGTDPNPPFGYYHDGYDYTALTGKQYTLTRDPPGVGGAACALWRAAEDGDGKVDEVSCGGTDYLYLADLYFACAWFASPTNECGEVTPGDPNDHGAGPVLSTGGISPGGFYTAARAAGGRYVGNCCTGTRATGQGDSTNTRWAGIGITPLSGSGSPEGISTHRYRVLSCHPFHAECEVYLGSDGRFAWDDPVFDTAELVLHLDITAGECAADGPADPGGGGEGMMARVSSAVATRAESIRRVKLPCVHLGERAPNQSCGNAVYRCGFHGDTTRPAGPCPEAARTCQGCPAYAQPTTQPDGRSAD